MPLAFVFFVLMQYIPQRDMFIIFFYCYYNLFRYIALCTSYYLAVQFNVAASVSGVGFIFISVISIVEPRLFLGRKECSRVRLGTLPR